MDEVSFKPRAYEKAARTIEMMQESISDIYREKGLDGIMEIPGIGRGIGEKIEELIETGRCTFLEKMNKKIPVDVDALTSIEGIGPKIVYVLYKKLKIKNVTELEAAAKAGKIQKLEGFGEKKEQNILKGIEFFRRSHGRLLLGVALPFAMELEERIKKLSYVKHAIVAGSIRRRKETIGDIDILVVSDKPEKVMDYFVKMPEVAAVYGKGDTKSTIRADIGCDVDLRVVPEKSFGAALNYFTGSKEHNVALRQKAKNKGMKLSEYGVFRGTKQIAGRSEEDVYKILGLRYVEPEMRENTGEIDLSQKNQLPDLVKYGELLGDLQTQTSWTDGNNTIKEMASAAQSAGLEYIAITDHTRSLAMAHGLDEKKLEKQGKEIDRISPSGIRIFKGAEVNILKDGSLDIKDETLKKLDVVGIAVHSSFSMPEAEMTKRVLKAMNNANTDILFHPTGRLLQKREPFSINMDEIIDAAKSLGMILEINAHPSRLDLKDEHIKKAVRKNVLLCIDSDAHGVSGYGVLPFGIAQARRGWAETRDILNTRPLGKIEKWVTGRK